MSRTSLGRLATIARVAYLATRRCDSTNSGCATFVERYNHQRDHESLGNLTPAEAYFDKDKAILAQRAHFKHAIIENRRLQTRKNVACYQPQEVANTPLIYDPTGPKCAPDEHNWLIGRYLVATDPIVEQAHPSRNPMPTETK